LLDFSYLLSLHHHLSKSPFLIPFSAFLYRIRIRYGAAFPNFNKNWEDFTHSPSRCGLIHRKINAKKTDSESLWGVRFLQRHQPWRSLRHCSQNGRSSFWFLRQTTAPEETASPLWLQEHWLQWRHGWDWVPSPQCFSSLHCSLQQRLQCPLQLQVPPFSSSPNTACFSFVNVSSPIQEMNSVIMLFVLFYFRYMPLCVMMCVWRKDRQDLVNKKSNSRGVTRSWLMTM